MSFRMKHSNLIELNTETINGKRHYVTPNGSKYISITTLLGYFSEESIKKWRKKVGDEEADRVSREASTNGTRMHEALELYLDGRDFSSRVESEEEQEQFNKIRNHIDQYVSEVWHQEVALYSDRLSVAGRVDLIATYKDNPTIIDFKTSRKHKKREWIHNYFMQAAFYSCAYFELTGIMIDKIAILISVDKGRDFQVYEEEVKNWIEPLCRTVRTYQHLHS